MKKNFLNSLIFLQLIGLIAINSSCSSTSVSTSSSGTNNVEIQILKPANIQLPSNIKRFGLVYIDKSAEQVGLAITKSDKELLHENAKKSCLNGALKYINDAEMQDTAFIYELKKDIFSDTSTLWENSQAFCRENKLDAIIYLSRLKIDNSIYPNSYYSSYDKHAELKLKTTWAILLPEEKLMIEKDIEYNKLGNLSDGKDEFIYDAGEMCGNKFGKEIIPGWSKTNRKYFYSGTSDFKIASDKLEENNWDEASKIWLNYLNAENSKIAGRAHFNLALYNEIQGNLDKAFELAKKADQVYHTPHAHSVPRSRTSAIESSASCK